MSLNKFLFHLIFLGFIFSEVMSMTRVWKPTYVSPWAGESCIDQITFEPNFNTIIKGPEQKLFIGEKIQFPVDGGLLLPDNSELIFKDRSREDGCDKKSVTVKKPKLEKWFSVDNWRTIFTDVDVEFNKATPDSEKIPCVGDTVVFYANSSLNIDLDSVNVLPFKRVEIEGKQRDGLIDLLKTESGQMMFRNGELATQQQPARWIPFPRVRRNTDSVDSCALDNTCHCSLDTPVCNNYKQICPLPRCLNPIQPDGFCCKICGAEIKYYTRWTSGRKQLIQKVENILRNANESLPLDSVEYYASIRHVFSTVLVRPSFGNYEIQVVIVDKDDYMGDSLIVADYLKGNFNYGWRFRIQASGKPYEPLSEKKFLEFTFIPLFMILAMFGLIYFYYYDETTLPRLLEATGLRRINPHNFVFARFDRRESVATVVGGAGLNVPEVIETENEGATAFDNPMFETQMDLKQTPATIDEESDQEAVEDTKFDDIDLMGPNEE